LCLSLGCPNVRKQLDGNNTRTTKANPLTNQLRRYVPHGHALM
jgi:hypothetical protein